MATISLAGDAGLRPLVIGQNFPYVVSVEVDLAAAAAAKGSALAALDVITAIPVAAGTAVLTAGVEVVEAVSGGTVLTIDVGATDADAFVDGFDLHAAVAGAYATKPTGGSELVTGVADTIDVTLATVTGTYTSGKIRVFAVMVDVTATPKPGLMPR